MMIDQNQEIIKILFDKQKYFVTRALGMLFGEKCPIFYIPRVKKKYLQKIKAYVMSSL